MKKIVDGKMYNTETARCVAQWDNGIYGNDFNACEEALYQTNKGQYFIAGEGGVNSKYSQSCGNNSTCGGSGIELLSESEAKDWLENHGTAEEYEKEFTVEEG